jgi:short-subunit dehydrogenase
VQLAPHDPRSDQCIQPGLEDVRRYAEVVLVIVEARDSAALSLTQSLRVQLAGRGVRVQAVLTGPVDTEMTRDFETPKSSPESVARGIVDGIEGEDEEIFPDPISLSMADAWRTGANKALERQFAALAG